MSRKTIIFLAVLIISPIIIYLLWPSDESRIKKLFREGVKAVEQENIEEVLAKVSFAYKDEYGMTYLSLKEGMKRFFKQAEKLQVEYEITDIRITENTAKAELDIRVIATSGSDTGYILGDAAKPLHIIFSLEKERTTWLVTQTEGIRLLY
jgi:uncharacterized protein (UPF0248 family)